MRTRRKLLYWAILISGFSLATIVFYRIYFWIRLWSLDDVWVNCTSIQRISVSEYCATPVGGYVMNKTQGTATCRIPKLDPFHPDAMKQIKDLPGPLRCETEKRATLSGGVLHITGTDIVRSSYRYITRPAKDDFKFTKSDPITINSTVQRFPVPREYIELTLELKDGKKLKEYLMQVIARKDIISRPLKPSELNLSILIIGIDSLSALHAQRKLPKTYNYIRDVLQGYVFKGHSVVGDGTTEQLAAMLTGKGEQEHHESRRGTANAKPVDSWEWIFKEAKDDGYVTLFCEDSPFFGSFHYRLLGFRDPPTDYYPRAFLLAGDSSTKAHCVGSEKIFNYHLDLTRKIYEQYPGRRKFLLHFASDISHNLFNSVEMVDDDLLRFMIDFSRKGYLNNTLLIVMGDHGLRYGTFRETVQGKLEERLPLFSMSFPKWFKEKYQMMAKNLKTNTERLTSWFDVYATFNHILEYPNEPKELKHGKSLLREIPAGRSCKDASIPEHWCPCMQWSEVDTKHKHVQQAALQAVDYINDMIFKEPLGPERCSELSLHSLTRAEVERPTTQVLRFAYSGRDGYEPKYSFGNFQLKDRCSYQIAFVTLPSHGVFEATVQYVYGRFLVKGTISRLNEYGDQPKCIANIIPQLREYCYCK